MSLNTTSSDLVRQLLISCDQLSRHAQHSEHLRQALSHLGAWLSEVGSRPAGAIVEPKHAPAADLHVVVERSRLKALACSFAIERNAHHRNHGRIDDFKARYDELIAKAKDLPRCILWMVRLDMLHISDESLMQAQACYQNLADAAALTLRAESGAPEQLQRGMELLAEAQSALMVVFSRHTRAGMDQDQFDAWTWVKEHAAAAGTFIEKFMSRESKADPSDAPDLARRIAQASEVNV
jgi:hypothetical protein